MFGVKSPKEHNYLVLFHITVGSKWQNNYFGDVTLVCSQEMRNVGTQSAC